MQIIFQPADENRLGEFLSRNLAAPWTNFRAAVAFVKRSGVRHIERSLTAFAERGDVQIIVGIDHRGTSFEGLQDLLAAVLPTGRIIVFHNPGSLTFHPKLFLFKSDVAAELLIGSGNLTAGGLYNNYEVGIAYTLDLAEADDAEVLASVERMLDTWSDEASGTASVLDAELLDRLLALGLTPGEEVIDRAFRADDGEGDVVAAEDNPLPFVARREPGAPRVPEAVRGRRAAQQFLFPDVEDEGVALTHFVMTLHQTDAGFGQTTPGASARSPEIFIPLAARNENPTFWAWPHGFEEELGNRGKFDRHGVRMRLGGEIIEVNMMTWPAKSDFRLRSAQLRRAGNVGDIIHLERVDEDVADFEYSAEVIRQGEDRYEDYLALCRRMVRPPSLKRYGYY